MSEYKSRRLWLIFLFVFILSSVYGEGSLVIRNWQTEDETKKVQDDRSNVYIEKGNTDRNFADTPKSSSAFRAGSRTESYEWNPKWHFYGVGEVRIPDSAMSSDKSLLAIVENTGKKGKLSGSRIILFNTYNYRVVKIIEVEKRKINKICFIPNTEKIACSAERQLQIKQPSSLLLIDCLSKDISVNQKLNDEIRAITAGMDGTYIFMLSGSSNDIYMLKISSWDDHPEKMKNNNSTPSAMLVSKDNTLLLASSGNIRQYDAVTGQFFDNISLPRDFTPTKIVEDPKSKTMALMENRGRAYILNGKRNKKFYDGAGNVGTYMGAWNLFLMLNRGGTLTPFELPGYEQGKKFIKAASMRPKTKGSIMNMWFLPEIPDKEAIEAAAKSKKRKSKSKKEIPPKRTNGVLVLDSLGNIYFLEPTRRLWRKQLILSAKK